MSYGTAEDVANTGNKASAKQLKWEKKRHHDMAATTKRPTNKFKRKSAAALQKSKKMAGKRAKKQK